MEEIDYYRQFKSLLEYFVAHTEWNQNKDENHSGYSKYIKPLIDNGTFQSDGQGYNSENVEEDKRDFKIQQQIKEWENYPFGRISLNSNGGTKTRYFSIVNYLNVGWASIYADYTPDKAHIDSLWIGFEQVEQFSKTIAELGLYNNQDPNNNLIIFYKKFKKLIKERNKNYWLFKHKPGTEGANNCQKFVEKAIRLNSGIMQYEYGVQEPPRKVTLNWNRAFDVQEGDIIFLCGDKKVYAVGTAIPPRLEPDEILSKDFLMNDKKKESYNSYNFEGIIHFEDEPVFYQNLTEGIEEWGQRIDVDSWKYYNKQGIFIKEENLESRSDVYCAIRKLKNEKGYKLLKKLEGDFMNADENLNLLKNTKNLILTGAPGTGKTFEARKLAIKLIFGKDSEDLLSEKEKEEADSKIGFVQFHSSYDYTDFVEGLRPIKEKKDSKEIGFERRDGAFKAFCKEALNDKTDKPYVFIIDEINRGEVGKIFGELFFAIEDGYRNKKVDTQYQNLIDEDNDPFRNGFFVPKNVFIIGTMNDIDRSVENMDFAFRRRFSWKEVTAEESQKMFDEPSAWKDSEGNIVDVSFYLQKIKNRMDNLNIEIVKDEYELGPSYQIGAAYFLKFARYLKDEDESSAFENLWNYHIKPLLNEYLRGEQDSSDKLTNLETAYENENPVQ